MKLEIRLPQLLQAFDHCIAENYVAVRNTKMNVREKYALINFMLKQTLTSLSFMLAT